jgi:futalosine hydrolase
MRHSILLVPTELERGFIAPAVAAACGSAIRSELCGFGPVVAAARTAQLIAEHRPDSVLLVGIAGRISDRLTIGEAYAFERVACHGVGASSGEAFVPAEALGWPQWPGDPVGVEAGIGDVIDCGAAGAAASSAAGLLVTACAASASEADVADRLRLFPAALAEDMEGYGVALACRLAGVPLRIVRGISNTAGDRDKRQWRITDALEAAAALAGTMLASAGQEPTP